MASLGTSGPVGPGAGAGGHRAAAVAWLIADYLSESRRVRMQGPCVGRKGLGCLAVGWLTQLPLWNECERGHNWLVPLMTSSASITLETDFLEKLNNSVSKAVPKKQL